jgi:putative colanic acid biosynthesis acetyltransferase WcaF
MNNNKTIAYQDLASYTYNIKREKSIFHIQCYRMFYFLLIRPSPKVFNYWRCLMYRLFGAKIGKGVRIASSAKFLYPWNIEIGNYCWIGENVELYSVDKIIIGSNVALAHNIFIATASHDVYNSSFNTIKKPVVIKDEVWIASNVFINMGVVLNVGVVVGSGSVVTKDLPEGYICLGNPAKPIKKRI